MAKRNILAGLDIGSSYVRTVIVEDMLDGSTPKVIGVGEAPSVGLRKGLVVDVEDVSKSINASVEMAENMAGVAVADTAVSISGQNIQTQSAKGVVAVGKADGEVTQDDVDRVINAACEIEVPLNNEIIHVIPKSYRLDDQMDIKNPLNMRGVRLEVNALVVEGFSPHIKNLLKCLQFSDIESEHFVFAPLAASEAVLTKKQQELGVAVVDVGAASIGVAVFEEGDLLHVTTLPFGAGHITNDIAIGIRSSIETAEKVKLLYGHAMPDEVNKKEDIYLEEIDSSEVGEVSRHHVAEIIEARLEEIFESVDKELTKIERSGLLPAGVVLVGGGAKMQGIVELAKKSLKLPVSVGYTNGFGGLLDKVDDPAFSTALGLVKWKQKMFDGEDALFSQSSSFMKKLPDNLKDASQKFQDLFKKFLP